MTASVDGGTALGHYLQAPIRTYWHGQGQHLTGVRREKLSCEGEFIITLDDAGLLGVFTRDADEPVLVHDIAQTCVVATSAPEGRADITAGGTPTSVTPT